MNIWIPEKMYRLLPWLCLAAGTVAWLLPAGVVAVTCAAYLYVYGGVMLWRRWRDYCIYN